MFHEESYFRYKDRTEAALALTDQLREYKGEQGVVLAVPRGGVPIGYIVARELGFALDIVVTKKIGHPGHKEYAIGAVSLSDYFITDRHGVSEEYIQQEVPSLREKLRSSYAKFMGHQPPESITGKTAIIIDDGVATGNTMLITINVIRKQAPAKLIVAVPVASRQAMEILVQEADKVVCPLIPDFFTGVGAFYEDFEQVSDEEVIWLLEDFRKKSAA